MNERSKFIREQILKASHHSGHGHIPTCFSIIEMLCAAYNVMRHDPQRPDWDERDIFVLSKGHGSLGLYGTLAAYGYFPVEDIYAFGAHESRFGCHPDRFKVPGVEASTGSLGHGIGLAVGMALGLRIKGLQRRVVTLIGDGESNEGTVWEALQVAAHLELDNLTVMLDHNRSQGRCLPISRPAAKFAAFDCDTVEVDGHDVGALEEALRRKTGTVSAIVANTRKGFGCETLVNGMYEWHRRSPKADELEVLLEELDAQTV